MKQSDGLIFKFSHFYIAAAAKNNTDFFIDFKLSTQRYRVTEVLFYLCTSVSLCLNYII